MVFILGLQLTEDGNKNAPKMRRPGCGGTVLPDSPGRPKGSKNKATQAAREAIAAFVDGNAHRLAGWLDDMAEKDPEIAFKAFMSVVEYHIPKLARSEITGKDGKDLTINWPLPRTALDEVHTPASIPTVPHEEPEVVLPSLPPSRR